MKLFVAGEDSPNPDNWSKWSEWSLIIAQTAEEASRLDGLNRPCVEVSMEKATVLVTMQEPAWGSDL